MTFDRHNDKATDVAQPHPKCEKLQKVGFACAGSTAYNGIGVFIGRCIEQIRDAHGIVKPVDAKKDSLLFVQFKRGQRIKGSGAGG